MQSCQRLYRIFILLNYYDFVSVYPKLNLAMKANILVLNYCFVKQKVGVMKEFNNCLVRGAGQLGIRVDTTQAKLMETHAQHLLQWNKKINLTAIIDPLMVAEKHFIDSIAASLYMDTETSLIDLGSGGGFPGIPLKIMNPNLKVVMVDASRKKVNFLKHVIRTLNLNQIDAIHSRVEDLHENTMYNGQFDCVISRAFTELSGFVNLAKPFLSPAGKIYAMKGKHAKNEITSTIKKSFNLDAHQYKLPYEKSDRYIIKLEVR